MSSIQHHIAGRKLIGLRWSLQTRTPSAQLLSTNFEDLCVCPRNPPTDGEDEPAPGATHATSGLGEHIGAALKDAFPFNRPRCDRLVEKVLDQLGFTFAKSVTPESLEVTSTRRQEIAEARMAPAVKRVDE
jgi:hypothetical protein